MCIRDRLYSIREAYDKIMDFAFAQTFSGTTDVNTALRRATKELVKRGVRTIPRKNGSNVSIEYATRSYVMNRMGAMTNAVQQMNHDKLGCDGWEISAHSGPAPDHAPIQGLQYRDAEYTKLNLSLIHIYTIRLDLSLFRIVLPDLLGGEVDAVRVKDL